MESVITKQGRLALAQDANVAIHAQFAMAYIDLQDWFHRMEYVLKDDLVFDFLLHELTLSEYKVLYNFAKACDIVSVGIGDEPPTLKDVIAVFAFTHDMSVDGMAGKDEHYVTKASELLPPKQKLGLSLIPSAFMGSGLTVPYDLPAVTAKILQLLRHAELQLGKLARCQTKSLQLS